MKKRVFCLVLRGFIILKLWKKNILLFRKKIIFFCKVLYDFQGHQYCVLIKKNQLLVNIHRRKYNKNLLASPAKKLALLIKMFYSLV